jgi:O-methyltransferase domain
LLLPALSNRFQFGDLPRATQAVFLRKFWRLGLAILFDQPHVIAQVSNTEPRLLCQAGDFFRDSMPAADAYLLWTYCMTGVIPTLPESWLQFAKSLPLTKAIVLVLETVIPDTPGVHLAKALDINMLVMTGGRERTRREHEQPLAGAGFRLERVILTASPYSIVEARAV